MTKIKFGTDGWRAIIAKEYTIDNLKRVSEATAKWLVNNNASKVVVGHDTRFAGEMFAETAARVLAAHGLEVHLAKGYVSTPMVSLGVVKIGADMGVVITASHNPPSYSGYKLKSHYGGPTIPKEIAEVEDLIPDHPMGELPSIGSLRDSGKIKDIDLEGMYVKHVEDNFDMQAIRDSNIRLAYDAMYGAGQRALKKLLPDSEFLHCEDNPSFMGQAPEPIEKNLEELSALVRNNPSINAGLANDGDADRIGMYDENGDFVDSHHILLLLLYYLHKHKGLDGKVVVTFSVTNKMRKLAEKFGLDFEVTAIGFKYIAEIMTREDVLVGGEESGGLAVKGHIPERDGIWIGLVLMEFMAKTGKSLRQLIQDVYDEVGTFSFQRDDLHLTNDKKLSVMQKCKEGEFTSFGDYKVARTEDKDGYKFYLEDDSWILVRPSGTEPVLRMYAEADTTEAARAMLDAAQAEMLG